MGFLAGGGGSTPGGTSSMMGGGGGGGFMQGTPMQTGRLNFPGMGGNMGLDMHRIPIFGNMFQNPYDVFKANQMQNAANAYSMYRPEAAQGFTNAMNAQSTNLQPMNNALTSMYGPGATQGYAASNPFGPSAFSRGAGVGTNPQMPPREPEKQPQGVKSISTFTTPGQAAGFERWRLGRTSDATEKNRELAGPDGNYGAGGPGLVPGAGSPGWTPKR